LSTYVQRIQGIETTLERFSKSGKIDVTELKAFDELATAAYEAQLKILNRSISVDEQRSLFGAVRNIRQIAKTMKESLLTASQRHENPETADRALEVCENLSAVAKIIDGYFVSGRPPDGTTLNTVSRNAYKKAKRYGFSEDTETQLKALNIGSDEIAAFTKKISKNLEEATDADDECVVSVNEGSN